MPGHMNVLLAVAYANNLYLLGGSNGTNYFSDTQYASIGYKAGTIAQTGTTVTGTGTAWTSAQIGSTLQYQDGSTAAITAVGNWHILNSQREQICRCFNQICYPGWLSRRLELFDKLAISSGWK